MENDTPNQTTKQLLIQPVSKAALLTDPDFAVTACNPAALVLFLYNQQDMPGVSISCRLSANSTTKNRRERARTNIGRQARAKPVFSKLLMRGCFETTCDPGEGTTIIVATSLRLITDKPIDK